jgi:hypothetical protein
MVFRARQLVFEKSAAPWFGLRDGGKIDRQSDHAKAEC